MSVIAAPERFKRMNLPSDLQERLRSAAQLSGRDEQAELEYRLRMSFDLASSLGGVNVSTAVQCSLSIGIFVALVATTPLLEYQQYGTVRVLIFGIALFVLAFRHRQLPRPNTYALALIALVFNPIIPLHLGTIWVLLDVAVAVYFGALIYYLDGSDRFGFFERRRVESMPMESFDDNKL